MADCIFCKISNGEINAEKIYENEHVVAFNDINPVAPVHILVIPKKHIESLNYIDDKNIDIISQIFLSINEIVNITGIKEDGYRIVNNCGDLGGQTVDHIHFHILGKRKLTWPPG